MRSKFVWIIWLCIAVLARSVSAAPDTPSADARKEAREHFRRATEAYDRGRYKDAIEELTRANAIAPSPLISYNIARAYERLGDDALALASYRDFLRREPNAPTAGAVRDRIAALEQSLAKRGVSEVTILSRPEHATVVLDGQPVGVTPYSAALAPGSHKLSLRLTGYAEASRDFELPSDHAIDVSVELAPEAAPAVPAERPAAPAKPIRDVPKPAPPKNKKSISPLTWASFGVGVAGLGAALGFELSRASAERESKSAASQVEAQDAYDRMQRRQTDARILLGVGAAASVLGGVLLYFDLGKSSETQTRVLATCSGAGCALGARGRF